MKTLLIQIVALICDLVRSLWDLLAAIVGKVWNSRRWSSLSLLGKIVFTAFILTFVSVVITIAVVFYMDSHGRYKYYNSEHLSENVVYYYYRDEKLRVYNLKTGKYTTPKVDWIAGVPLRDSLTVFCYKGKRGFLNVNDGRIVIPAQYEKAWVFSEGLAAVYKDGKIGFINARNEVVLPFQYDYAYRKDRAIDYLFREGYCTMTNERGACGLIDTSGNWCIDPLYDCIWPPHGEGCRIVKDGNKYGLIDNDLRFRYPIEYDYISFAAEDVGILLSRNGRKWQVDFAGNVTRPFVVDYTGWIYIPGTYDEESESSKLSEYLEYKVESRVGVLRRDNGSIVIPAIYETINMLSETLFEAQLREEGDWILIDTNGNIVDN